MNDRFILRSYSPSVTIAGGVILNPLAARVRRKDLSRVRRVLGALQTTDRATQFVTFVEQAKEHGQTLKDICARTGWRRSLATAVAEEAQAKGLVINCDGVFIAKADFENLSQLVIEAVRAHHKREPLTRGMGRETLRERFFSRTAPEVFRTVLSRLERDGLLIPEKEIVRATEHKLELAGADAELRTRLEDTFRRAGLEPPSTESALQAAAKSDTNRGRRILQMLIEAGTIVRIQPDMLFHRAVLDELIAKLNAFADNGGPERAIDVPAFKSLAGVSRKYAIPLLEYFDREHITLRRGDRRIIIKR